MPSNTQTLTLTLTKPQYEAIIAALDLYGQTMLDNQYREATVSAQVAGRAADAMQTAWRRATDGF